MNKIAKKVINKLSYNKLKISIAESCSGGLLSSAITSVSGSSKVFDLGLVTYSNKSKIKVLKISKKIVKKYGAVSEQVCKAMAENIAKNKDALAGLNMLTKIEDPNAKDVTKEELLEQIKDFEKEMNDLGGIEELLNNIPMY